ncbi:MAG: O-antigen ligase family protein [Planctomycetes bacterium]|nr:O-antigen ligase family protein [Planctomycetota bacterium]
MEISPCTTLEAARARLRAIDWGRLHLYGAIIGVALQPLSTASGNIGFAISAACTVPQVQRALAAWKDLFDRTWTRWLVLWACWSFVSLIWSSDRGEGFYSLKALRVLLWIPVLWPLRRYWWTLVAALLAGTTLLQVLQAVQVGVGWPVPNRFPAGSLWTTPTQTGLWDAVSVSFWLMLAVHGGWRNALAALPMAVLSATALVWTATRASAIGLAIELVVANAVLAVTSPGWWRRALLRCAVGVVILASVSTLAGSRLQARLAQVAGEARQVMSSVGAVTAEERLAMWKMAILGWMDRPILGAGVGGIRNTIAQQTTVQCQQSDLRTVGMVHSTYLQTLAETGVVGATLLAGWLWLALLDAWRSVRLQPVRITTFGALLLWLVAAAFDGYQQSGGFLTVGAICMALATMPAAAPDNAKRPSPVTDESSA